MFQIYSAFGVLHKATIFNEQKFIIYVHREEYVRDLSIYPLYHFFFSFTHSTINHSHCITRLYFDILYGC